MVFRVIIGITNNFLCHFVIIRVFKAIFVPNVPVLVLSIQLTIVYHVNSSHNSVW
jgi:hypothetical protein